MTKSSGPFFAGVDAGSRTVKIVVVDGRGRRIAVGLVDQGLKQNEIARRLFSRILRQGDILRERVVRVIATGYGREGIAFADRTITEITCHAEGVRHLVPAAATVVDIGGQDSKLIRIGRNGRVRDFVMNDRCAAGTGRFLEIVASRLERTPADLGRLAKRAGRATPISHMCAVFAETEIVGLLASGQAPEEIAAGVQRAVAARIAAMAGRRVEEPVVLTGGVALIPGMAQALEIALGCPVATAPDPQLTGALGAALLAREPDKGR